MSVLRFAFVPDGQRGRGGLSGHPVHQVRLVERAGADGRGHRGHGQRGGDDLALAEVLLRQLAPLEPLGMWK